jgi:acyl-CoA synthetase
VETLGARTIPAGLERRYRAAGWWTEESLGQLIARGLGEAPGTRCRVRSSARPWEGTYAEVMARSLAVAAGLRERGVGPGDVVAFQLPNWLEAALCFYAASFLGAVVVPIVHFYGEREVGFILGQSGARLFVTAARFGSHDYLSRLERLRPGLEEVLVVGGQAPGTSAFEELEAAGALEGPVPVPPDSPALVAYTSGTTAEPKGVVHSQRSIAFEVRQLAGLQTTRPAAITGAPVGHGIGLLSGLLVPIQRRLPINLIDAWDPAAVLKAMLEDGLSAGSGSTYFLTSLLDHPDFTEAHVPLMREVGLGGSPIPAAVAERADQLGLVLMRSYGSTEHPSTTGCTHADPRDKRLFTDGRPLEGVEVRICEDDGSEVRAGEQGEVVSRGPDLFAGYTDPALTAEAVDDDGWYRTGDIGRLDPDGYLVITDRKKDIIIRGGENVSAAEVEEQLVRLPGVAEVAVVAAPDPRLGEHGCAFFRMADPSLAPPGLEQVRDHLRRAGLAPQKWPEELRVVEEFPRTSSGKVQKFVLRQRLREGA